MENKNKSRGRIEYSEEKGFYWVKPRKRSNRKLVKEDRKRTIQFSEEFGYYWA